MNAAAIDRTNGDTSIAASLKTLVILSLLSEPAQVNAATRTVQGVPVLTHTLARMGGGDDSQPATILVWDDQLDSAKRAAGDEAIVQSCGPRNPSQALVSTEAALRWSDGWRGALLGNTEFDRGFDAPAILRELKVAQADAALLINPASVRFEPATIELLVAKLEADVDQPYAFAPGPIGAAAMLIRRETIEDLARNKRGPGSMLTYHPDRPQHDPLSKQFAVAAPPRVARSSTRVDLSGERQSRRLSLVMADNAPTVELLIEQLDARSAIDALPREVTIELTTRRATRPVWSILPSESMEPSNLSLENAKTLFAELAAFDDVRVTFAGTGDPLLHPQFDAILDAAVAAGIKAIHVETDLLADRDVIERLATSAVDVVSVHLPAVHRNTYASLMGADRIGVAIENIKTFITARAIRGSGVPILVPTFVKCAANVGEMEAWYDQWIRAVGVAVIAAPSDLAGRITYVGGDDLTPPQRRPCRRLNDRITVRSDGSIMPCEEAIDATQAIGSLSNTGLGNAWTDGLAMLRSLHAERRWDESDLCRRCRMWDRP